jgi:hypothetical protein
MTVSINAENFYQDATSQILPDIEQFLAKEHCQPSQ